MDPAEERGRVGEIHPPVSVQVGAGMAFGGLHWGEVQGVLIGMLAAVWHMLIDLCLPPEAGLSSNDRSFCNTQLAIVPGEEHQIRLEPVVLNASLRDEGKSCIQCLCDTSEAGGLIDGGARSG